MQKIYITRKIPEVGIQMLRDKGYEVDINPENKILSPSELIMAISQKPYNAILSLLTDNITFEVLDAVPSVKIISNYAVGFNNIDVAEAKKRGIIVANTAGVSSESVAEHTVALVLALSRRILEGDKFMREGKYTGWDPMLLSGTDLKGKTLGILGAGRIGYRVGHILAKGFEMNVIYNDVNRNEMFEKDFGAIFCQTTEEVLQKADFISLHVPLLDSTHHLINAEKLKMMKSAAFLINTSRGPVVDETALVTALQNKTIAGAGLDVFENEPQIAPGLADLSNVILTPHIASSTLVTREKMAEIAAQNIIDFFQTGSIKNKVVL